MARCEALSRLTSEGLVEAEPNTGFRVAPITQEELEALTRTRIAIECGCLSSAIAHGDLNRETGIVATLFELFRIGLEDPDDPARVNPGWVEAHRRFHEALVAGCNSGWMLRLHEILSAQSERYRSAPVLLDRRKRDIAGEHKAIADAAIARDAQAACTAMRYHLLKTTRILVASQVARGASETFAESA
ncbi:FCD domain-containing protein [Paracoccus sp. PXZ]